MSLSINTNRSLHLDIDIYSFEVKKLLAEQILGHVLFLYSYEIGSHIKFPKAKSLLSSRS